MRHVGAPCPCEVHQVVVLRVLQLTKAYIHANLSLVLLEPRSQEVRLTCASLPSYDQRVVLVLIELRVKDTH